MSNIGKNFEKEVAEAFGKMPDVSVDRLYDTTTKFLGHNNICDYIIYRYPHIVYVECKATKGNTLNFKSGISENQWNGLLDKSVIKGVVAGYLVWFHEHDITSFVPAEQMSELRMSGKRSLHVNDLKDNTIIHMPAGGRKKRIYYDYDFTKTMEHIDRYARGDYGLQED